MVNQLRWEFPPIEDRDGNTYNIVAFPASHKGDDFSKVIFEIENIREKTEKHRIEVRFVRSYFPQATIDQLEKLSREIAYRGVEKAVDYPEYRGHLRAGIVMSIYKENGAIRALYLRSGEDKLGRETLY